MSSATVATVMYFSCIKATVSNTYRGRRLEWREERGPERAGRETSPPTRPRPSSSTPEAGAGAGGDCLPIALGGVPSLAPPRSAPLRPAPPSPRCSA